ncbi:MAG: D-cysteine desulfhydrase [Halieaceae bacterium]|jgi:D-cysteine desulfhydrase
MSAHPSLNYPRRVGLAQLPTPLQRLRYHPFQNPQAPRIWVKRDDLTGSVLSGNKVRKLEFVAAAAQDAQCDVLITTGGVQSNHCRATALVGAQLGMAVHLILRGDEPNQLDGNLLLGELSGASVSYYPKPGFARQLDERFAYWQAHFEARGRTVMCIPTGASNGVGLWGYIAASEELLINFKVEGIRPSHIVTATGSGGTQAGLTCGMALFKPSMKVWGVNVCDDEAWFQAKVREDVKDWQQRYPEVEGPPELSVNIIDGYVGQGYGRASSEVFDTIVAVAQSDGLVLDPVYTGKAFHGMCKEIEAGRFDGAADIVFVHTGGVFGLFAQRESLARHLRPASIQDGGEGL